MPPGHHKRQTWGQGHREAEGAGALVQARGKPHEGNHLVQLGLGCCQGTVYSRHVAGAEHH